MEELVGLIVIGIVVVWAYICAAKRQKEEEYRCEATPNQEHLPLRAEPPVLPDDLAHKDYCKEVISILAESEGGTLTASDIGERLSISTQRASMVCRQLVDKGYVNKIEIKIPRRGTCVGYKIL